MKKKYYLICAIAALTVVLAIITWNCWLSTTRVAFINYQVVNLGEIYKANKNSSITIHEVTPDNLDQLDQYDMVFINGHLKLINIFINNQHHLLFIHEC